MKEPIQKLKLIKDLGNIPSKSGKTIRHCAIYECPYCGKPFTCLVTRMNRGKTKSCGCYKSALMAIRNKEHPHPKHGLSYTRIYKVWQTMKNRCYWPKAEGFYRYGGRGITVCAEWLHDPVAFVTWARSHGYTDGIEKNNNHEITINRINNDSNYEPSNCEFTTYDINNQNTILLRSTNTSGYRDIYQRGNKWYGRIRWNNKRWNLGGRNSKEEAAEDVNNFILQNHTPHPLNILPEWYLEMKNLKNKDNV